MQVKIQNHLGPFISLFLALSAFSTTAFASVCVDAQRKMLKSLGSGDYPPIVEEVYNRKDFGASKPSISEDGIRIYRHYPEQKAQGTPFSEVWCKLKTKDALEHYLKVDLPKVDRDFCGSVQRDLIKSLGMQDSVRATQKNHYMGGTWIGNPVGLSWGKDQYQIKAQSLWTSRLIPKIPSGGGKSVDLSCMQYCKMISKSGLVEMEAALKSERDALPLPKNWGEAKSILNEGNYSFQKISWDGDTRTAYAIYKKNTEIKGTLVLSPGGGVPSLSMRGLSKRIADEGYLVFLVEYVQNLAILEPFENSAVHLAERLKSGDLYFLSEGLKALLPDSAEIIALGHSLGGAILGKDLFSPEPVFDRFLLVGTSSFVKPIFNRVKANSEVRLFVGSEENSLKDEELMAKLRTEFDLNMEEGDVLMNEDGSQSLEVVPGLNHFCIITDSDAGVRRLRDADGSTALSTEVCIDRLVKALRL